MTFARNVSVGMPVYIADKNFKMPTLEVGRSVKEDRCGVYEVEFIPKYYFFGRIITIRKKREFTYKPSGGMSLSEMKQRLTEMNATNKIPNFDIEIDGVFFPAIRDFKIVGEDK